jgi:Rad3-related DNA helicase
VKSLLLIAATCIATVCLPSGLAARVWTDTSGSYTLEADLVAFNDTTVVLQRADHELVAMPLDKLSDPDREYLKSREAGDLMTNSIEGMQTWTLRNGTKITGRIVDFTERDVTLQRRRGRIYVNDRVLENLPEFYQLLLPQIVAKLENLRGADRRALEAWLVRQRGQPRTFHLEGVVFELESGDEYAVPFFLFSDEDSSVIEPSWDEWKAAHGKKDYDAQDVHAFLLRTLAAARHRDKQVQREIAMMQLKLQAVQAGVTSLWEVTLYPAAGQGGPPQWVVMPGRNSRDATAAALQQNPGFVAGPVRRVGG